MKAARADEGGKTKGVFWSPLSRGVLVGGVEGEMHLRGDAEQPGEMHVRGDAEQPGEMHVRGNAEQPSKCSEHALVDPADQKGVSGGNSFNPECNMQKREDLDKVTQELRECLPPWVTLDQVFNLICKSDGDVVGAVTEFHERETELFDQLSKNSVSDLISQAPPTVVGSGQDIVPALSPSKVSKQLSKHRPVKDASSLNRKDVSPATNPKRKLKHSPSSPFGPKQSTITSFFGKHVQKSSGCSAANECLVGGIEKGEFHVDVLNSFMKITGENVTENDAIDILKSAKDNLNVALDTYYGNFESRCNIPEKLNVKKVETQLVATVDCNKKQKRMMDIDMAYANEPLTSDMNASCVQLPVEKFSPIDDACWKVGQPAPYLHLAHTFDLLERERGKIKATSMLCNMFRSLLALSPEDVLPAVYLCTNRIAAEHMNVELNVGGSLVSTAIEEVCGTNKSRIRELYNKFGDLGDVAQHCRQTQSLLVPPCPLTIQELFSTLRKISKEAGNGSVIRKKSLIVKLMRSCRAKEIKFLVRTLVKNMRIGAMLRTILPSLAQAVVLNSCQNSQGQKDEYLKRQLQAISEAVIHAYNILPSLDFVVPSLLGKGIDFSSSSLSMAPGVPIKPMLARITNGVDQVLKLFQGKAFTCEYKYDGQRAQIHKLTDGSVQVFSRNGEETTCRFPDLVDIITGCLAHDCESCILDSEVVAIDRINGNKLLPFQKLSSRERGGRDSVVLLANIKVNICVFVFDVMLYNGQQLLMTPLRQRRKFLSKLFNGEKSGYFEFAKEVTVEAVGSTMSDKATMSKINSFLEDAWNSSSEGIIVKTLDADAGYAPSKRADTWLKVKRDYVEGMSDSLDLVPVGAWYGNGRKAGWYSPFLMACYNPEAEEYQSVCRVMSGFSDSFYAEMKEFYAGDKLLSKKPLYYQTAEVPDVWFSPELVWEIRGADFTISPVHHAAMGLVHPSRGISIRFPRFVRSIVDRMPEDCSTDVDVSVMYKSQTRKTEIADEE